MSRRRVVVTGLGIISPVGNTVDEAWSNILAGKSQLFSLNDRLEGDLNQTAVSAALQKAFEDEGIDLTGEAQVSVVVPDRRWRIDDGGWSDWLRHWFATLCSLRPPSVS